MSENVYINLQPTEQHITVAAAQIFAAYIVSGEAGSDSAGAMQKAVDEAIQIARMVDDKVITSGEMA